VSRRRWSASRAFGLRWRRRSSSRSFTCSARRRRIDAGGSRGGGSDLVHDDAGARRGGVSPYHAAPASSTHLNAASAAGAKRQCDECCPTPHGPVARSSSGHP
jgi:hypothetical protein